MLMPSHVLSMTGSPLLSIRDLTVKYLAGGSTLPAPALHKLDLDVFRGEIVGILGESGAGKSTLAAAILTMLPTGTESTGSIRFQGQELQHLDESHCRSIRGARIARIVQEPGLCLNPVMRVGDQIAEVVRAHSTHDRKARREQSEAMLGEVGFSNVDRVYKAYPHQLSGGELHRVAIAQALVCRPTLVIADEPTRSLDVTAQGEILRVLRETHPKSGSALIFITHNPALLAGFADRVVIMYAGRIVEEGPVTQVFRKPLHPYTRGLLRLFPNAHPGAGAKRLERLPAIPGALAEADLFTPGCAFAPRCSARTAVCHTDSPVVEIQQAVCPAQYIFPQQVSGAGTCRRGARDRARLPDRFGGRVWFRKIDPGEMPGHAGETGLG
jgi:oligopeptide/dipeptide ABC transporter ATP-binding protein